MSRVSLLHPYILSFSITVPLHPACKTCNYIHYMLNYMLPMMLMLDISVRNISMTRDDQYQHWAHMHGPTDPCSCGISFHLQGKKLPGGFNQFYHIISWMPGAKTWVLKPRTFALSTLLYEHAKSVHFNSLWNKFANESNFDWHHPTPHTTYISLLRRNV